MSVCKADESFFWKLCNYPTILESIKHAEDDEENEDDGRLESKVSPSHPFFGIVFLSFSTHFCCLLGSQRPSARQCHAPWVVNPGSFSNTMLVERLVHQISPCLSAAKQHIFLLQVRIQSQSL